MGYIGRRIGKSQDSGDSNPAGADGAVGGGILDLFSNGYFERQGDIFNNPGTGNVAAQASGGVVAEYSSGSDIYKSHTCLLYTSPSPRDRQKSRMPSSA